MNEYSPELQKEILTKFTDLTSRRTFSSIYNITYDVLEYSGFWQTVFYESTYGDIVQITLYELYEKEPNKICFWFQHTQPLPKQKFYRIYPNIGFSFEDEDGDDTAFRHGDFIVVPECIQQATTLCNRLKPMNNNKPIIKNLKLDKKLIALWNNNLKDTPQQYIKKLLDSLLEYT